MKKWLLLSVLAVVVLVLAGWWIKEKFFVTDEMRVKRLVSDMARFVEKGEITKLGEVITEDYSSAQATDKTTLLNAIRLIRLQYAQMFIYISDQVLVMGPEGQTAEVTLVAKIAAKPRGGGADTEYHAERVRLFFRKTADGWKMERTEAPKLSFD